MDGLLLTRRERLRSYGEKTGLVLMAGLVGFLLVISWFISHPIHRGD